MENIKTFERGKNAKELGIDKKRKFIVVIDYGYTRINNGDILELYYDDYSNCPYFDNLTTGDINRPYYWHELYYANDISLRDIINSGEYENI